MIPGQEEYLFNKVRSLPDDAVVVEIGSFKGRSTVAMGYACIGTQRRIYCIDTWDGNDSDFPDRNFFDDWQDAIQNNQLLEYVIPIKSYSHVALKNWVALTGGVAIDFIFIDGSHQYLDVLKDFELSFPLVKVNGWIGFHDVISTWPGSERVWHNIAAPCLANHEYSTSLACGQKLANSQLTIPSDFPIHFFTIVLNGDPFIRYHLNAFIQLPFSWHWHIVEGVAELKHDTAWSLLYGGEVPADLHREGLSNDGTTEYIDQIAQQYPEQITVYRKPRGEFWDGKLEMVSAPLPNIQEECLLWQVDADELWTSEQIDQTRSLFLANPDRTAAYFSCHFFVGANLVISNPESAMYASKMWLRAWRFQPGMAWAAHEPPTLVQVIPGAEEYPNVAELNPFLEAETAAAGLIFQHFAYATVNQLQFKEKYYGYANIRERWQKLQQQTTFPVLLRDYFEWLQDASLVDRIDTCEIQPLAAYWSDRNQWEFTQTNGISSQRTFQLAPPAIVVDGAIFEITKTGIAAVWRALLETWAGGNFTKHLLVLDRHQSAPLIPGIRYQPFPSIRAHSVETDSQDLQALCDAVGASLFISTYYTRPTTTPSVAFVHDMVPEAMNWRTDLLPECGFKYQAIQQAIAHVAFSTAIADELKALFPAVSSGLSIVTPAVSSALIPASTENIHQFTTRYGISKPYFLLHKIHRPQRDDNRIFFKAFAQLCSRQGFEIVYLDNTEPLPVDLRQWTSGSVVYLLQLEGAELAAAYSGAIALVYPTPHDSLGLPILEAMTCGCPVITCKTPFLAELVGEAVLSIAPENIEALAIALCDIQKPTIRQSLVASGLAQAKQFSVRQAADALQTVLIDATLASLNLRTHNVIAFPDWRQPEADLLAALQSVLRYGLTQGDRANLTLLLTLGDADLEMANMALSEVTMFLFMEAGLGTDTVPELSLVPDLGELQWQALLPKLSAWIPLPQQDELLLVKSGVALLRKLECQSEAIQIPNQHRR
jgi:glycosyltransferase involved in cell wall biosynthesis